MDVMYERSEELRDMIKQVTVSMKCGSVSFNDRQLGEMAHVTRLVLKHPVSTLTWNYSQ